MNNDNPITFYRGWANACFSEANICDTIVFKWTGDKLWGKDNVVDIFFLDYCLTKEILEHFFKKWIENSIISAISIFEWMSESQWKFEFKIEKWTEYDVHIFNHNRINVHYRQLSDDYYKYDINDSRRYSKEYLDSLPIRENYDEKGYRIDRYIHPGNEKFLK